MSSTDPPKKHPCPDCRFCQWCGDDRCSLCLRGGKKGKKLSLAEQVELYERVNRGLEQKASTTENTEATEEKRDSCHRQSE